MEESIEEEIDAQEQIEKPLDKPEIEDEPEPIEPCDPATMNCDQMRDKILELSTQRAKYDDTIKKLDEIKTVVPSEDLNNIYNNAVEKKKNIDDEIYDTFEQFSVCARPTQRMKDVE